MIETEAPALSLPPLPPALHRLRVPTGVHRRWLKFVVFGGWKTGKSYFLSTMPRPILAIDCGEGGIGMYLPKDDPQVHCVNVTTPAEFDAAIEYALRNQDKIASVAIDPITELWTDYMDWWSDELKTEQIQGGQWKKVKAPWKNNLRRLMRANFHVGYAAWLKEVQYEEGAAGPGEKGKLEIHQVLLPALERTVGYTIDMLLGTNVARDRLNQPTSTHIVRFWGGRRPLSVPPTELYIGKEWRFDARKPVSPWDTVIAPMLPQWEVDGMEDLGAIGDVSPAEQARGLREMQQLGDDAELGRLLRLIAESTDASKYRASVFPEIQLALPTLPADAVKVLQAAHEAKKKEFGK